MDGRRARGLALALLAAAAALLAVAAVRGDLHVGFLLFIPFVAGTGGLAALAMLLLMAGLALLVFSRLSGMAPPPGAWREAWADEHAPPPPEPAEAARRVRSGGVILLGPIPIVWGSDRRILPWMVGAGLVLLALALALTFALR